LVLALGLFVSSSLVWAWDGAVGGTITQIDTVSNEPNNYEFRVYVNGGVQMCNNTTATLNGWAYLNSSDANYKEAVANLTLAYAMGKHVTIYTMNDNGVGCHIHYVMVSG
jgi:hypothetical protein